MKKIKVILAVTIAVLLMFTACGKDSDVAKAEEIYTKNLLSLNDEDGRKLDSEKTYILRLVKAFDAKNYKKTDKKLSPKIEIMVESNIEERNGKRKFLINRILDTRIVLPKDNVGYSYSGNCEVRICDRKRALTLSSSIRYYLSKCPTEVIKMEMFPKEKGYRYYYGYDYERYGNLVAHSSWGIAEIIHVDDLDYIHILNY